MPISWLKEEELRANSGRALRGVARSLSASAGVVLVCLGAPGLATADVGGPARGYELVTPNDKGDSDIIGNGTAIYGYASRGGDKVLYRAVVTAFPGDTVGAVTNLYVGARGPSGWATTYVNPPDAGGTRAQILGSTTPDLTSLALISVANPGINPKPGPVDILVGPAHGPYRTVAVQPLPAYPWVRGVSDDGSHVAVESMDPTLAPAFGTTSAGVFVVYDATATGVEPVNVDSTGLALNTCGAELGAGTPNGEANAVSADGSKIFFSSPDPIGQYASSDPACQLPVQVYVREHDQTTVRVSAPQPGVVDPSGTQPAYFAGAARDGSKVFFVSSQQLTADDTGHDAELYEFNTATGSLSRVSRGTAGTADANVRWAVVSSDGSTAYFVAMGQLMPGEGSDGEPHLYRYDTGTGVTTFIPTPTGGHLLGDNDLSPLPAFTGPDYGSDWYVTPDGRHLLFPVRFSLNDGSFHRYERLYRYAVASGAVSCVSCPPPGGGGKGIGTFSWSQDTTGFPQIDVQQNSNRGQRAMSDDGSWAFFNSPDQLLPQDTNQALDVYAWHDGTLSLISSGHDPALSHFMDAGADGRDVFFATHARMATADQDDLTDVYDARLGGGFPATPAPIHCAGDGCAGPPSAAPAPVVPGTFTYSGPGNAPAGAASGFRVRALSAADRHAFARTSRVRLVVEAEATGRLTATAVTDLHGRTMTVARASHSVTQPGTVRLTLRLSSAAHSQLRRHRRLTVRVVVRLGAEEAQQQMTLTLAPRRA